jgi:hypothetical protein
MNNIINKKYTHFIYNKKTFVIYNGFDYSDLDSDEIKYWFKIDLQDLIDDLDLDKKDFSIATKKYLLSKGIDPFDNKNWFKFNSVGKVKNIKKMPVKKAVKKKAVTKKVAPKKAITKRVVAKKKVNISYDDSWGKYLDSNRQALPKGRRLSKPQYRKDGSVFNEGGKIYYENRPNHSDVKQKAKKGKMLGLGKITGMPTPKDPYAISEIELWAKNDSALYYSHRLPILKNLYKKYKKGLYDIEKATKLYRYYIDSVMKSYHKNFGSKGDKWFDLLSTNDRQILAKDFAIETLEEFENGEIYI